MTPGEKSGYCTLCRSRCGTINTVDRDMLVRVRPDPGHPTGQAMCMKGRAAPELVHSPHRILYPMRRTAPKGAADPGWQRIGWDEALSEIARRLDRIRAESGAEAVAFGATTPSGTPLSDSIDWIERFVRAFGSPNICYATEICNWHKDYAHAFTYGCGMPVADYRRAELILLWGHNPANTWLAQANAIGIGRAAGARMIVVDPRRTALAAQADAWLQVRPGTDAALALGLIHLLLENRGYDAGFVRDWTNAPLLVRDDTGLFLRSGDLDPAAPLPDGFMVWRADIQAPAVYDTRRHAADQGGAHFALRGAYEVRLAGGARVRCRPVLERLARHCADYSPGRVRELTGVPEAQLHEAAALLGRSRRVAYHAWTGIGQQANATQTERAVAVLYALTGSFDAPGGNRLYAKQPVNAVNGLDLIPAAQRAKALGLDERPLGPPAMGWITARDMYTAILHARPYRVRALMAFGSNPLVSQADTGMAEQALAALEFHVHCDLFETPTAKYADILLPVNTPWEREGLRAGFELDEESEKLVQLRPRMVPPRGEARSDCDIVFDLATRLGMDGHFFDGSLERGWNHMLAPLGITVQDLREAGGALRVPLPHIDRKYASPRKGADGVPGVRGFDTETRRVDLYSERLLRHGYDPLPAHHAPDEGGPDYPLALTSAKSGYYCHSQHRSLVSLRKRAMTPQALIHPELAARKGIADGDWMRIRTRIGQARFVARLDGDLRPDVVVADFGWWQACTELGQDGYPVRGEQSSNYNALISAERADPVSGSVPMRAFRCNVERDAAADPARRPWAGLRPFVVAGLRPRGRDVLEIALAPADGSGLPDYQPGQHVTVRATTPQGETLTRAYSLTGAARVAARGHYTVAVRRQHGIDADGRPWQGRMSGHLHTRLAVGDRLDLGAPAGQFILPLRSPQPVVLFAGGIGITPFLSYLESLAGTLDMPRVWLHYANRNSATQAYAGRIAALAARLPRLTVIDYYDAPLPGDAGVHGQLSAAVVGDALIAERARFYLCGPTPMMQAITQGLTARGVPAFDIFSETFRSPPAMDADPARAYQVKFARSAGAPTARWSAAQGTLLGFAESLGLKLPSGCRVGQCESCAVSIISGQVRHLHGSEPEDPATCLACQAVPVSDLVIDA